MHWQTGFKRIRLIGTGAFALGAILMLAVILTQTLGYAPNPGFAQMYSAFWPLGLMLIVLGALLWLAVWVLMGFLPSEVETLAGTPANKPDSARARFYQ